MMTRHQVYLDKIRSTQQINPTNNQSKTHAGDHGHRRQTHNCTGDPRRQTTNQRKTHAPETHGHRPTTTERPTHWRLSWSLDFTDERKRADGSIDSVVRALQNPTVDVSARLCPESEKTIELAVEGDSDIVASDTESVSSGSTSGAQDRPRPMATDPRRL
jgi:hypothetical protein